MVRLRGGECAGESKEPRLEVTAASPEAAGQGGFEMPCTDGSSD